MSRLSRLESLEEELVKAGHDKKDAVYRATLGTLVRQKRKVRVLPPSSNKFFDYDKLRDQQRPTPYGSKLDPENPPAPPYHCSSECETCFTQTFPVRIEVTDEDALARITALTTSINGNLDYLRSALHDHADYIVTKWRKSKAKRSEVLSAICAQAAAAGAMDQKPDFVSLYDKKWAAVHLIDDRSRDDTKNLDGKTLLQGSKLAEDPMSAALAPLFLNFIERMALEDQKDRYQTTWLLPYLDVESLIEEPLLFLALLHARTAHSPEEWMMFDNSQLKLGEHWETLIPEFNSHYVSMTGADYGKKLIDWDKEGCHHWNVVGYQKSIYILTAQHHMMRFLRETVARILRDRTSEQRAEKHAKWEHLVQNGFFSFGSSSAVRIRASANQPFSVPPTFDPAKTFELVDSMYQASIDELDLAQTSPAFVQSLIRAFENSLYSKTWGKEGRWGVIADEVMCTFYRRFIWWRQMHKECQIMLEKYQQCSRYPTEEHREEYESSVFCLHNIAVEHFAQQNLLVQYSLPFQRGFERNFGYERKLDENKEPQMFIDDEDAFHNDILFWSIRALGFDQDRQFTLDPSFNFRVFDSELSRANVKERNRISEQLLRSLSEMAVVDEIRTTIECDRSWNREPRHETLAPAPKFREDFIDKYAQQMSIPAVIERGALASHLRSFHKNTSRPSGKVDSSWLTAAATSREQLNNFWRHFRVALKGFQIRKQFPSDFIEEDQKALSAADRPSNIRAVEEETQALQNTISDRSQPKSSQRQPSRPTAEWPIEEPEKFVSPPTKGKKKTRPSQSAETRSEDRVPVETSTPTPLAEPQLVESPTFVKPENFGLFQAMFTTPKAQMRAYSWVHFTQAMVDAGCSVTQGSGSAVHFRKAHCVIVLHRPHPEPTIAQEIFIAMGKRLKKRFGWTEETFHCGRASE